MEVKASKIPVKPTKFTDDMSKMREFKVGDEIMVRREVCTKVGLTYESSRGTVAEVVSSIKAGAGPTWQNLRVNHHEDGLGLLGWSNSELEILSMPCYACNEPTTDFILVAEPSDTLATRYYLCPKCQREHFTRNAKPILDEVNADADGSRHSGE